MNNIHRIQYKNATKEELLPGLSMDFPYISSYVDFDRYATFFVPWHWHREIELFYIESGALEYETPSGTLVFPAGSGGLVNSNVLHMTRPQAAAGKTVQLEHIFDASFLGGQQGSRTWQKYVMPILAAPQLEIIALRPDYPAHAEVLTHLIKSFQLSEQEFGYEMKLREVLSGIWLELLAVSRPILEEKREHDSSNEKIKIMMVYIHEHFSEKISIAALAAEAFISERECFRVFRSCLHLTPAEYIRSYRLQAACLMLANSSETVTSVGHACGLGSSSYFGKIFRDGIGCTPIEYRHKWQDYDR